MAVICLSEELWSQERGKKKPMNLKKLTRITFTSLQACNDSHGKQVKAIEMAAFVFPEKAFKQD